MEFMCTKVINTDNTVQFSAKPELEAHEKLFSAKKETSALVNFYENFTTISALDDNENELYEKLDEVPETLVVKEEIESDHENNFELLELDIKKEFESYKQKEITEGRLRRSIFENNSNAYNCHICEKTFETFYECEAHRKQHSIEISRKDPNGHATKTKISCGFCNKTFESDEVLVVHHRNDHKELKFSCEHCGKVYLSLYSINKHIKSMHFKIECDKCRETFFDRTLFNKHRKQHKGESIECRYCQKEFNNMRGLDVHVNMQHKQDETMKICDICHKEFINVKLLKRHYGRTHDKCFKCPHCDKAFALRCSFQRHFLTHTGAKDYKCNVCGRQFSRQRSLKNHVALHSDKRSFQCNQCPKAFKTQPSLRYHKFSHSRQEKYQCAICLQIFTIEENAANIKHIKDTTKSKEIQDNIRSIEEMAIIKRKEEERILEKKKEIKLALHKHMQAERERQAQLEEEEKEKDEVVAIIQAAKHKIECLRKDKEKELQDAIIARREEVAKLVVASEAERNALEEKQLREAIAERDALEQMKMEKKIKYQAKIRKERLEDRERCILREKEAQRKATEVRKWEMLNRYKNDEITKIYDENRKKAEWNKILEYRKVLFDQMDENEKERLKEKEINDFNAVKCFDGEDAQFFDYADEVMELAKRTGRSTYPIEKVIMDYKKINRLKVPVCELSNCEDYAAGRKISRSREIANTTKQRPCKCNNRKP